MEKRGLQHGDWIKEATGVQNDSSRCTSTHTDGWKGSHWYAAVSYTHLLTSRHVDNLNLDIYSN